MCVPSDELDEPDGEGGGVTATDVSGCRVEWATGLGDAEEGSGSEKAPQA